MKVYTSLVKGRRANRKKLAVLIDPDKMDKRGVIRLVNLSIEAAIDYFFVGGSLLMKDNIAHFIQIIKASCQIPVIIFPGSIFQINPQADAIFFLSLISGRNPDLLIGQQVLAAPLLRNANVEVMGTGYLLIDGGQPTTVSYISNSQPIPANKPDIAVCTAMAGQMLGMKIMYLDSGSGAQWPVSTAMIAAVSKHVDLPLIVGGGIRTPEQAVKSCIAGADVVVVGNALEKDPQLVNELTKTIHEIE